MIYIKPIQHSSQICDPDVSTEEGGAEGFMEHIDELVRENNIEVIADEWNDDRTVQHGKKSNMEKAAEDNNLPYIKMEISDKELNVPIEEQADPKHFPQRHRYWYKMIKDVLYKNILIVCGNNHISTDTEYDEETESFDIFLKSKGISKEEIKIL